MRGVFFVLATGGFAAFLLLGGCGGGGSGGGGESDPVGAVLLESMGGDAGHARVAAAPDGTAAAVWVQDADANGNGVIYASVYTPGRGWETPQCICGGAVDGSTPAVAVDGGGAFYAVWVQDYYHDGSSWVYRNVCAGRYAGGTWGEIADLNGDLENPGAGEPDLALDGEGSVLFVWKQRVMDADQNIYVQYFDASSETWPGGVTGPPHPICQNDGSWGYAHGPRPAFCPDTGEATVVWYQDDLSDGAGGVHRVRAATLQPPSSWGSPELISDPGDNAAGPRVCYTGAGHQVIAWEQDDDGDLDTENVHAARPATGGGWVKRNLSNVAGDVVAQEIAVASSGDGAAWIAWHQVDTSAEPDQGSFGVYGCKHQAPASWTDAQLIRLPPESPSHPLFRLSLYPRLAMNGAGDSVLLSTDGYMGVQEYWYFCSLDCPDGGSWSSPVKRSDSVEGELTSVTEFLLPGLDAAGPGAAFAVWNELEEGSWNVYGERFTF